MNAKNKFNENDPGEKPKSVKTRNVRRSAKSKRKPRKIVLIGASKSGKTALAKRFVYNTYSDKYTPTVEEVYHCDYSYHGYNLNLEIIDLPSPFQFPAMRDLYIYKADIIMLVYEIGNKASIKEVRTIYPIIKEQRSDLGTNLPVVLVGTKSDQVGQGTDEDVSDIPVDIHTITSAKYSSNINESFELGLDGIVHKIRTMSATLEPTPAESKSDCFCCCL